MSSARDGSPGPIVDASELAHHARRRARGRMRTTGRRRWSAALPALGIGPGDEVITSPFTFVATLNAILETGATARVRRHRRGLLPRPLHPRRADGPCGRRAMRSVHLYGLPGGGAGFEHLARDRGWHWWRTPRRRTVPGRRARRRLLRRRLLLVLRHEDHHLRRGRGSSRRTTPDWPPAPRARNQGMRPDTRTRCPLPAGRCRRRAAAPRELNATRCANAAYLTERLGSSQVRVPRRRARVHHCAVELTPDALVGRPSSQPSAPSVG